VAAMTSAVVTSRRWMQSPGPLQKQRVNPVEVHPDGVLVAGMTAGHALAAGAQPVPDIGGRRRGSSVSRARVRRAKEETRASSRSPARSRISAVRGTLRSR
jgi:hypothetical protein